jgi:hypothetical protein
MSEIKRKPRFRLSLRAMMILVLVAGGSIGWKVNRARTQARSVELILAGGGRVSYDFQETGGPDIDSNAQPWAPLWLRKRMGDEFFQEVTRAHLSGDPTPETWVAVSRLHQLIRIRLQPDGPVTGVSGLRSLSRLKFVSIGLDRKFYCLGIAPIPIDHASIEEVESIPNLESFAALSLKLNADDLRSLGTARNLRELNLDGNYEVTDGCYVPLAGLDRLRRLELGPARKFNERSLHELAPILPNLEQLYLGYVEITDRGMAELKACTSLKTLQLSGEEITDAGFAHLAELPVLEELDLWCERISDAWLAHVRKMRSLRHVHSRFNKRTITKAGVDSLKAERPTLDCESLYPKAS